MKPDLNDLDALIKAAKELKSAQQGYERKAAKARDADLSLSMKAIGKLQTDMHWDAMHVERLWDTLHARAVDLGLCDAKTAEEYAPRALHHSSFHDQKYQPAVPRCMRSAA